MKKIYIVMAVIMTAALVSCEREKSFDDGNLGENSVVFAIKSGSTRSAQVVSEARKGIVIPLETESGSQFILEETVTSLDQFTPATKGAPAYTENLGKLYANDLNVWGDAGGFRTDATFSNMENSLYPRKDADLGSGWRYQHDYTGDPWPSEDGDVGFYLNMPAEPTNVSITGHTGGKFTFTYTSPATAAEQQDILFAYRTTNKAEYLADFHPNGIPVLFNHALTAVKFAIGNDDTDISTNKIKITKITFKNLVDKGTCTITPVGEAGDYKDIEDNYSSATAASWASTSSSGNDITSGTYGDPVDYESGEFGDSWYSAGNNKNLNKADGSQTFWLIPQTFDANSTVKLTIEYTFDEKPGEWTIDFGKLLAGVEWKAGQLRTYTIKIDDVNVKIEDTVTNTLKESVVITNTGNTDAYIRAAIIGQWLTEEGDPVFGFIDKIYELKEVASWYEDQFVTKAGASRPARNQGTFTGLVGYDIATSDYWVKGADGYYYYKYVVPADNGTIPGAYKSVSNGIATDVAAPAATEPQPLFSKYQVGVAPDANLATLDVTIHFELEIATQAVSAMNTNGSYMTWTEAWKKALGYDPSTTNPIAE